MHISHSNQNYDKIFIIFLAVLFILGLFLLSQYGVTYDTPKNLEEGRINFQFLTAWEPLNVNDQVKLAFQIHGSFIFMIAHILNQAFGEAFGQIYSIHLILIFLSVAFFAATYYFFRQIMGSPKAFWACAILLTLPRFFGHMFNNLKDVPLLIFFTLAILSFYHYLSNFKARKAWLYFSYLCFALALVTKIYALFTIAIIVIWLFSNKKDAFKQLHANDFLVGVILCGLIIAAFYVPAFWGIEERGEFFAFKKKIVDSLAVHSKGWNLYSFKQILVVTPAFVLLTTAIGLGHGLVKFKEDAFVRLLVIWFSVVMLAPCTPFISTYDGIRHFFVVLAPLAFLSVYGIQWIIDFVPARYKQGRFTDIVFSVVVGFNILALLLTHPFQTTYFNMFVGGLKGAQNKTWDYSYDYWLNSYQSAIQWINANAAPNANVLVINTDSRSLLDFYDIREDLRYDYIRRLPLPRNSYIIVPYRTGEWPNMRKVKWAEIEEMLPIYTKVHEVKRQGGQIYAIYYNE